MALFFINQKCLLCQKEINDTQKIFSFPAFIQNTNDQFYQFNDSVFHLECLQKHPLGNRAIRFAEYFVFSIRTENRICTVGKNKIRNFEDYIFVDLLTTDEQEDLYQFNFMTIDKNNLYKWKERGKFIAACIKFKEQNKWSDFGEFNYLDNLVEKIKE
jgi:hypothetical protein